MSRMNCCVVNCANSYEKCPPGTKFFRFPGRQCLVDQRERWIRNVRRVNANGTEWQPAKWSRVCSAHFVGGKSSTDPASPSYAPAIFPPTYCKTSAIAEDKRSRYERWTKRTRALFAISDPSSVSLHEDVGEDEPVDSSISSNDDCGVVESLPDVPPQCDENELSRHEVSTQTEERCSHMTASFVTLSCLLDSRACEASVQCSHIPVPQSESCDKSTGTVIVHEFSPKAFCGYESLSPGEENDEALKCLVAALAILTLRQTVVCLTCSRKTTWCWPTRASPTFAMT